MDYGHEQADKMLKDLEKKIQKEYKKAAREVEASMNRFLAQYRKNDREMMALWKSGKITKKDYTDWRKKQILLSDKWKAQRDELTQRFMEADKVASRLINEHKMDVYALNYNYGTYEIEKGARINTGFSLYSRDTVARLIKDDPKLLPPPGKKTSDAIRRGELKKWNNKQVQSVMTQGILQGESIQKLSKRLAVTVGEKNAYSHYRAARTMTTSAENAGRLDSYLRAEKMGIKMGKTWLAAHDNHTRASHRAYDGMTIPLKDEFAPNLMFPGDPDGDPAEVYNCRCSLVADVMSVDGVDLSDIGARPWAEEWEPDYNEWKNARAPKKAVDETTSNASKSIAAKETLDKCTTPTEVQELMAKQNWFYVEGDWYDGNKLIDITKADLDGAKDIFTAFERTFDKYPQLKGKLAPPRVGKIAIGDNATTLAQTIMGFGRGGVTCNIRYYSDYERLKRVYERGLKQGFNPKGTKQDAVMVHEIGHCIDDMLTNLYHLNGGKHKSVSSELRAKVARKTGVAVKDFRTEVSEYATKNADEWFAECFSEYMTSDSPRKVAKEFGEMLDEIMEGIE